MNQGELSTLLHKRETFSDKHDLSSSRSSSFDSRRKKASVDSRRKGAFSYFHPTAKWSVASPMTAHAIREPITTPKVKRSRSRSFNDYIDSNDDYFTPMASSNLLIPPLNQGRKPSITGGTKLPSTLETSVDLSPDNSEKEEMGSPIWLGIMYGIINATIVMPVIMSFGSIIYRNEAFQPYMPVLIKLTLASAVVHQLCFSTFSSLPFAVGQVQDAGLIFLSSMATNMVVYCREREYDDETLLATVTIGLSTCTAVLGLGLIIIGKLRLAGFVQMLPTCVVGGYLGYIGWFCGVSGVMIMAGVSELSFPILFENIVYVLPGLIGGAFIYCSVRTLRHAAVLPMCIIILLVLFYAILGVTHTTVEEATKGGWIREAEPAPVWYRTWDYLKLNKVVWSAIPQLVLTELSMIFVVALSSSLDVAAIELELKEPLDYDGELTMVGVSNLVSGLTGGYTGSYIFSQTIFSLRGGVQSRVAGFALAACQIIVFVTPFPILSYVPNFFYGSLLIMICIDLMYEWLWDIRTKLTVAEYIIGLFTFALIQLLGIEYGILAGIVVYVACRQLGVDVGEHTMVNNEVDEDPDDGNPEPAICREGDESNGIYLRPA
jgi:MFS superfamily sulfate permease-like transporter